MRRKAITRTVTSRIILAYITLAIDKLRQSGEKSFNLTKVAKTCNHMFGFPHLKRRSDLQIFKVCAQNIVKDFVPLGRGNFSFKPVKKEPEMKVSILV